MDVDTGGIGRGITMEDTLRAIPNPPPLASRPMPPVLANSGQCDSGGVPPSCTACDEVAGLANLAAQGRAGGSDPAQVLYQASREPIAGQACRSGAAS